MHFMFKGAGLWRIVSSDKLDPNPVVSSSHGLHEVLLQHKNNRLNNRLKNLLKHWLNQVYEAAYNQYQTPCDIAASYICRLLGVEAFRHIGNITKLGETWDVEKTRSVSLSREVGTTQLHTNLLKDKTKDNKMGSS